MCLPGSQEKPKARAWPTGEEVSTARVAGLAYGSGHEGFVDGTAKMAQVDKLQTNSVSRLVSSLATSRPTMISPTVSDALAEATLASNRSAITGLGFEPRRMGTVLDERPGSLTLNGVYDPKIDFMVNTTNNPSTYVHEAAHRGLKLLEDGGAVDRSGLKPSALRAGAPGKGAGTEAVNEEGLVRYIMRQAMGDPEGGEIADQHRTTARLLPHTESEYGRAFQKLEAAAAQEIKRRRPGGPR